MDKKKIINYKLNSKVILALLGLVVSLVWLSVFYFPDNKLHLVFCNVGQGDAILISKGFDQVLIDGGPDDKVLACLADNMPFWDKTLDIIALTHPEADHLTGLLSVLAKYEVKYLLTGPEGNNSTGYFSLLEKLRKLEANIIVKNPYTGEQIRLGEISFYSLWPQKKWIASKISGFEEGDGRVLGAATSTRLNNFSLVFLLEYRGYRVLLMGDAGSEVQDEIMASNSLAPVDILKFPHHGSKTGIDEDFLKKISPKETVVSVGKNSYGHPAQEALDLLRKFGVLVRRTDIEGDVNYKF